ncbi:MAG: exodeoxyribonuclease V subunit gamma [Polyangiales bacterium]
MHFVCGNNVNTLFAAMVTQLRVQPAKAFEPPTIVVPHSGLQRWLNIRLADEFGCWTGDSFPRPREVVGAAFDSELLHQWEPKILRWRILGILEQPDRAPQISSLLPANLSRDARLSFATQVAATIDETILWNPAETTEWKDPKKSDRSSVIYRALLNELGETHLASCIGRSDRLSQLPATNTALHLFCTEQMPPTLWYLFLMLSENRPVFFYHRRVCKEYWEDVFEEAGPRTNRALIALGNSLRRTERAISSSSFQSDVDSFVELPDTNRLAKFQNDVLTLQSRPHEADSSMRAYRCASVYDEANAAVAAVIQALNDIPDLEPHEIQIRSLDIEKYVPYLQLGWATSSASERISLDVPHLISTTIAYRSVLRFFDLCDSRGTVEDVLGFLAQPNLAFDHRQSVYQATELRKICRIQGIYWGFNDEHRQQIFEGLSDEHTWHKGLDRISSDDETIVDAVRSLRNFIDLISKHSIFVRTAHSIDDWRSHLRAICSCLLQNPSDTGFVLGAFDKVFRTIADGIQLTDQRSIEWSLLDSEIRRAAPSVSSNSTGRVGIRCLPLSASVHVPAKVIVIMGLGQIEFPSPFDPNRHGETMRLRDEELSMALYSALDASKRLVLTHRSDVDDGSLVVRAFDLESTPVSTCQPLEERPQPEFRFEFPKVETTVPAVLDASSVASAISHPLLYFAREALGIEEHAPGRAIEYDPLEPFDVDVWELADRALQQGIQNGPDAIINTIQESRLFSASSTESAVATRLSQSIASLRNEVFRYLDPTQTSVHESLITDGDVRWSSSMYADASRSAHARFSKLSDRFQLSVWIRHLVRIVENENHQHTIGVSRKDLSASSFVFGPADDPQMALRRIANALTQIGSEPIRVIPDVMTKYLRARIKGSSVQEATLLGAISDSLTQQPSFILDVFGRDPRAYANVSQYEMLFDLVYAPLFEKHERRLMIRLRGNHLIEASAGTGKSFTITTLVVRTLIETDIEIDKILIVTFTRAATAELKARVDSSIAKRLSHSSPEQKSTQSSTNRY